MANVKISDLTPIDLSYTGDLNPQELIDNLYLVGDYTYVGESEDNTETGGIYGGTLADGIWDYLNYVPDGEDYSMLGGAVESIIEPYLSEHFSELLSLYMPGYIESYLSEIHSPWNDFFGILALQEDEQQVYSVVRITEKDVILGYLTEYFEVIPLGSSTTYENDIYFCCTYSGLSEVHGVTLGDLKNYIKST